MEALEKAEQRTAREPLKRCLFVLFAAYALLLIRITLFKQAPLYNLLAAVGASERTVSLVPLRSLFDLLGQGAPLARILENIIGNIALFVPLGLLLPALTGRSPLRVILCGACASLGIELLQYLLALGSADIDDLLLNTAGTALGCLLFLVLRRIARTERRCLAAVAGVAAIAGVCSLAVLMAAHAELFQLFPREVAVENGALVEAFAGTPPAISGKLAGLDGAALTVEGNVHSADAPRPVIAMQLTDGSRMFVCRVETRRFFGVATRETNRYAQLTRAEFTAPAAFGGYLGCNVQIWSADGRDIDALVLFLDG